MALLASLGERLTRLLLMACLPLCLLLPVAAVAQQEEGARDDALEIMETFNQEADAAREAHELTEQEKHRILFYMGVALLVLLVATAYLGVSMVVFGKQVFVAHMVCAGLTVTLGIAHAVAAVVWFFPF